MTSKLLFLWKLLLAPILIVSVIALWFVIFATHGVKTADRSIIAFSDALN